MVDGSTSNDELQRRLTAAEARAAAAEAALAAGEAKLRHALEVGRMEYWEWHPASDRVTRANTLAVFGDVQGDAKSHAALDSFILVHPDDRERHQAMVQQAGRHGEGWHTELRVVRQDSGEVEWIEERASPATDPVTGERTIIGFIWNITERKRAEAALRENDARHRLLIESWAQAVWETDADGVVVADSPSWRAYTGQTLEAWLGYGWLDAIHPDNRAYAEQQWRDAIAARGLVNAEFRLRAPDGGWRWTNVLAAPVLDARGNIDKWAGMNIDIDARKRSEAALRESDERFQQFARASSGALWIRDAETLAMEYASPALASIYGVEPGAFLGDIERWAAAIVPEDRDSAFAQIELARRGDSVVHEFRIQRPTDGAFRWIRNTDFPFGGNGHVARIGGIAEDITEAKLAAEHQGILLAELQHRVRNIMAILRSIAARTSRSAGSVEEYAELIAGRLDTFARVQALLTRAANVGVGIATIVNDELSALAGHAGQFDTDGPDFELSPKAAETMTLAVHELATNALKYGALSAAEGMVRVRWEIIERQGAPWLSFDWNESGSPPRPASDAPRRVGFGSELIEGRIPYELGGRGKVRIEQRGAECHLEFPLKGGASILETGAPQRATVFGGAIDMTGQPDLTGQRILVVEDDYYLASDTARALSSAGADVLGPCPTEDAARFEIRNTAPTAAVLDINLGGGRSFDLAGDLKRDGVPFVFITGYDQDVIPERFADAPRLQKPVEFRHVVEALAGSLGIAP